MPQVDVDLGVTFDVQPGGSDHHCQIKRNRFKASKVYVDEPGKYGEMIFEIHSEDSVVTLFIPEDEISTLVGEMEEHAND